MNFTIPEKYNFLEDYIVIFFLFFSFCLGNVFINLATIICFVVFIIKLKEVKIYINQIYTLFYLLLFFWFILILFTLINDYKNFKLILKSIADIRFIILPFVIIYMVTKVDKKIFNFVIKNTY